ncbi:hypothetical protein EV138_3956 [Kribbella voronezhensis]|uniref:Uncharacterized protein n=1 Tax=Kribbella voronezhensis TaxID=2512212 RepID=A0A4R7TE01_9ACTN|nr:hypothetical protein [Kribbella voronezhensis]TDU90370.1 hypothetical protein EV138_3956 [Kribbella voronezhensis]
MDTDLGTLVPSTFHRPGGVLDLFSGTPKFATVRANVAVLRAIVANGTTAAFFTVEGGRDPCSPWLSEYRERLAKAVGPWLEELSVPLTDAWAALATGERLRLRLNGVAAHRIALQRLTLRSNTALFALVVDSSREFEQCGETGLLADEVVRPRIAALTATMVALDNRFLEANPSWR